MNKMQLMVAGPAATRARGLGGGPGRYRPAGSGSRWAAPPLRYTDESLALLCRHVGEAQDAMGRRLLIENPSSYLAFRHSPIPAPAFLGELARRTGCGILCDVNNVFVTDGNLGGDPAAYLAALPADTIGRSTTWPGTPTSPRSRCSLTRHVGPSASSSASPAPESGMTPLRELQRDLRAGRPLHRAVLRPPVAGYRRSPRRTVAWHDGGMHGARSVEPAVGLAIMAKAPRAGAVKTRLCPPLRPPEAAELARCFLLDTVARVAGVAGVRPILAYEPEEARAEFERLAPGFALIAQRGEGLGARQGGVVAEAVRLGHEAVLLIGTDAPTLPSECLDEAVDLVMAPRVDLVLGPTEDGGYYLIGLRTPCPALFEDMPWSSSAVLARTLDRGRRLGLRVACLPRWYDVDTGADLDRLGAELAVTPGALPRHTREFLARRIVGGPSRVKPADHEDHTTDGGGAAASSRG